MRFLHIDEVDVRTNIDMDDQLVKQAMRSTGAPTKKAVVEAGLRLLVQTHSQVAIRKLRGKVKWQGNLDDSRLGRVKGSGVGVKLDR